VSEAHARLGPSNHRWPHCPGSVREEAPYPDIPGEAAIDGTGSHLLLELCLTNNVRAETYDQQIIGVNHPDNPNGWLVGIERCVRVQMALDYISTRVKDLRDEHPGCKIIVESETRSDPGGAFGRDDWWGTCDITITVEDYHGQCVFMEVADYKDGQGWVDPKDNTQLISYLFGKIRKYIGSGPQLVRPFNPEKVRNSCKMTVIQPKTTPVIRHQHITPHDLVRKAEGLSAAAWETDRPDAPLIPDDKGGKGHCRWCKHKPNCTALAERDLNKVVTMSTEVTETVSGELFDLASQALGNIDSFDTQKLTKLIDAEPGLMSIFDKAKEELQRRLEAGEKVPGWAMQPGRGSNIWNDTEENIAKALKGRRLKSDDIYVKSFVSVSQVMKHPKLSKEQKERIQKELVTYKAGADKLTRVNVEHEQLDTVKMFADVTAPAVSFLEAPKPVSFL
jgi:hypothetical protein